MPKFLMLIVAGAFLALPASAYATGSVSEGLPEKTEEVSQSQEELALVKDDSALSPEEKLQKELIARKNIIEQALSLSLKEVDNLRLGLGNSQFAEDSREAELKTKFLIKLNAYNAYFSAKAETLKNSINITLEEVKAFAQEIINYRDGDYNSSLKEVVDFILLSYNGEAISTTEKRLEKISLDIEKLERLNLVKPGLFKENIDKVKAMTLEAKNLYGEAKLLILAVPKVEIDALPLPLAETEKATAPSAPASEPATINETVPADAEIIEPLQPTAGELITSSLNKVKAIYEVFLQISKDIRSAVGIR